VASFSIGEILVKAGVVSQSQVDEAVKESGTRQRLLGRTLIEHGWLTPNQLRAGLEAQSFLRDGVVDSYSAVRALSIACNFDRSFLEALSEVLPNLPPSSSSSTCKLGELLVSAEILDLATLESANAKSLKNHEPLGKVLLADGLLTESFLDAALELQVRVRDGLFSREQAVEALKQNPARFLEMLAPAAESSDNMALQNSESVRIGELLKRAEIVSEADVLHALEFSRAHRHPIGEMLLARGFITRSLLDAALSLQKMVGEGQLSLENATACLVQVFSTDKPVSECLLRLNLLGESPAKGSSENSALVEAPIKSKKTAAKTKSGGKWSAINFDFLRPDKGIEETALVEESRVVEAPAFEQTGEKPEAQKFDSEELDRLLETLLVAQEKNSREALPKSDSSAVRYVYVSTDRSELYENQRSTYSRLARVLLKQRQFLVAEELLAVAIDISAQQDFGERQAEDQMFLAGLYLQQGKTWQSERLIKLCLATFEGLPKFSERVVGLCHHRLGLVYCRMGLFVQAEKQFLRACELMKESDAKVSESLTKRRLAAIYKDYAVLLRSVKREMEAAKYYAQARAIQRFDH
jgi:tetratricopeptide (TPR) repeat protein